MPSSQPLNSLIGTRLKLLAFAAFFFVLSFPFQHYSSQPPDLDKFAETLKSGLKSMEKDFYNLTLDKELIKRIVTDNYSNADLTMLESKPYSIMVYQVSDLLLWNKHADFPSTPVYDKYQDGIYFVKLKNGYYQLIVERVGFRQENNPGVNNMLGVVMVAAQLIKHEFNIQNKYLENSANPLLEIPDNILFSLEKESVDYRSISLNENSAPLYYYSDREQIRGSISYLAIILQCAGIFLLLLFIQSIARQIVKSRGGNYGFGLMALAFLYIRGLMYYFKFPWHLYKLPAFQQKIGEETFHSIFGSLGDLFISILMLFWCMLFFYKNVHLPFKKRPKSQSNLIYVALFCGIFITTILVFSVIRSLVVEYDIVFDVRHLVFIDMKTLLGILCLGLILLFFFFLCQKVSVMMENLDINWKEKLLFFGLLVIPYLIFIITQVETFHFVVIAWLFIFVFFSGAFSGSEFTKYNTKQLFFGIAFITVFATTLVYSFNQLEQRESIIRLADEIAIEEDKMTEYYLGNTVIQMVNDPIIQTFYKNPMLPVSELIARIEQKYLNKFENYATRIYPFEANGQFLRREVKGVHLNEFNEKINKGIRTIEQMVYLIPNPVTGVYNYIYKIPIWSNDSQGNSRMLGFLVAELEPKSNKQTNLYPELIIADKFRKAEQNNEYSQAIYKDGILETFRGSYPYNYRLDSIFFADSIEIEGSAKNFIEYNDHSHFRYSPTLQKTVLVSYQNKGFEELVSLFSYLFFFALIALVLVAFANQFTSKSEKRFKVNEWMRNSLRNRINLAMLMMLITTFFTIGMVTGWYFYKRSSNNNLNRLMQKQREVLAGLEKSLERKNDLRLNLNQKVNAGESDLEEFFGTREELTSIIRDLSDVHSMDVNIYDKWGELVGTSMQAIFGEGLLSNRMEPEAFYQMKKKNRSQFIHTEKIGKLKYLAAYVPIMDNNGTVEGFLNLPHFAQEKELQGEISSFIVTLVNVYVFLFLGGIFLAFVIANSITNPLRMIGDRLREFKLGGHNERLEWKDDDEIGALVTQYNATIEELDNSAKKLAKSERQFAWQQMARQVAHEIKNPLTPMKLSIQHLQRAYKNQAPNLMELTERVSKTLIEQIDTLSKIASEFSAFAKMPKPQNELVKIEDLITNVVNLYRESDAAKIFIKMPERDCYVFADRSQLLRVFNNLVKNALQAIPDEREGIIVVNVQHTIKEVIVGVADNGIGIGDDKAEMVFAPNFTTKSSGMGLGLAMSKNIIETAQGKIWFESKMGEGTTFFIRLPLAPQYQTELVI